jgi:hypothetical protein
MQSVNDQLNPMMGTSASSSAANPSSPVLSSQGSADPDFPNKMTSLGEVQRIIGLSLSKIQMGRNQRGGLPLHKNLLVATVLNKARDLYMQETMYMNYKMMTGQFAAAAASANNNDQYQHSQQGYHHYGSNQAMMQAMQAGGNQAANNPTDDDMEPNVEANEADYDEDSESDVEDECDVTSVSSASAVASASSTSPMASTSNSSTMQYPPTTMASMLSLHMLQQQQIQQVQHHQEQQQLQQQQAPNNQAAVAIAGNVSNASNAVNSDEGFIDEPDCDCDARNFSTSESRVPFQYCYNCAPFHPSNGRGPTLVPSPCPSPSTSSSSASAASSVTTASSNVLYDMDNANQVAEQAPAIEASSSRGIKRRRTATSNEGDFDQEEAEEDETNTKKRRESTETSPDSSRDESGYLSSSPDSSQHEVSIARICQLDSRVANSFTFSLTDISPGISHSGGCRSSSLKQYKSYKQRGRPWPTRHGDRPNHQPGFHLLLRTAHHGRGGGRQPKQPSCSI